MCLVANATSYLTCANLFGNIDLIDTIVCWWKSHTEATTLAKQAIGKIAQTSSLQFDTLWRASKDTSYIDRTLLITGINKNNPPQFRPNSTYSMISISPKTPSKPKHKSELPKQSPIANEPIRAGKSHTRLSVGSQSIKESRREKTLPFERVNEMSFRAPRVRSPTARHWPPRRASVVFLLGILRRHGGSPTDKRRKTEGRDVDPTHPVAFVSLRGQGCNIRDLALGALSRAKTTARRRDFRERASASPAVIHGRGRVWYLDPRNIERTRLVLFFSGT